MARTSSDRRGSDSAESGGRGSVLLALLGLEQPALPTLQRAITLSHALQAEVCVVRVVPAPAAWQAHFLARGRHLLEARAAAEVQRTTRARLSLLLGAELSWQRMELCFGGYVERVAEQAARIGARAIVVQGDGIQSAKAPGLAHRTGLPVLVARKPSPAKRIVACTDLKDTRYPVLRCAAELATKLHAPVMAVHNIPVLNLVGDFGGIPLTHWFKSTSLVHCTTQLIRASEQLAVTAIPIVLNELNSVDAILQQARAFEADLIVAGTYGRNWCARALTGSVAADLVARSPRSVLLTPLSGAPAQDALS